MNAAKIVLITIFLLYTTFFSYSVNSTPILITNNSELIGATGVSVNGQLYDVTFLETPCTQNYFSCTTNEFTFKSQNDALFAASELLAQVFVDLSTTLFDSDPTATFGCNHAVSCQVLIPYLVQSGLLYTAFASNLSGTNVDGTGLVNIRPTDSLQNTNNRVFARFSLAQVSEPSPVIVVALALLVLSVSKFNGRKPSNTKITRCFANNLAQKRFDIRTN